ARHIDPSVGCTELCVLKGNVNPRSGKVVKHDTFQSTISAWGDDPNKLIQELDRVKGISVYVAVNPVSRDLMARSSRFVKVESRTEDADVICIRWLYIDFDPKRVKGISSTDAELEACRLRLQKFLDDHPELVDSAIWGCSGNGYWLIVRLTDYPN